MANGFVSFGNSKNGRIDYYIRANECNVSLSYNMDKAKYAYKTNTTNPKEIFRQIQRKEKSIRHDARVKKTIIVELPNDIDNNTFSKFCEKMQTLHFQNVPVLYCLHEGLRGEVQQNKHCHIIFSERDLDNGKKNRKYNEKQFVEDFKKNYQLFFGFKKKEIKEEQRERIPTYQWKADSSLARQIIKWNYDQKIQVIEADKTIPIQEVKEAIKPVFVATAPITPIAPVMPQKEPIAPTYSNTSTIKESTEIKVDYREYWKKKSEEKKEVQNIVLPQKETTNIVLPQNEIIEKIEPKIEIRKTAKENAQIAWAKMSDAHTEEFATYCKIAMPIYEEAKKKYTKIKNDTLIFLEEKKAALNVLSHKLFKPKKEIEKVNEEINILEENIFKIEKTIKKIDTAIYQAKFNKMDTNSLYFREKIRPIYEDKYKDKIKEKQELHKTYKEYKEIENKEDKIKASQETDERRKGLSM